MRGGRFNQSVSHLPAPAALRVIFLAALEAEFGGASKAFDVLMSEVGILHSEVAVRCRTPLHRLALTAERSTEVPKVLILLLWLA